MIDGVDILAMRQRQFLVHSYLYYVLDEVIIADFKYDRICKELYELQQEKPGEGPYWELCKELDASGSGFFLKEDDYPWNVVVTALELLWQATDKDIPFRNFYSKYGFV